MQLFRYFLLSLLIGTVTACGSGGSSEGAGSSTTLVNGRFTGNADVFFSVRGTPVAIPPDNFMLPILIEISERTVTVTDADGDSGSAPISADGMNFIVPIRFTQTEEETETDCRGATIYSGNVEEQTITGTVSGGSFCTEMDLTTRIAISGTFSANRIEE